jgi:hypothetical protein
MNIIFLVPQDVKAKDLIHQRIECRVYQTVCIAKELNSMVGIWFGAREQPNEQTKICSAAP